MGIKEHSFQRFRFSFDEIRPRPEELRSFLKSENKDLDRLVDDLALEILPLLSANESIEGGYLLRKAADVSLDTGAQVRGYMRGAEYFALFVCTAGPIFTELSTRYQQESNFLEAFITDALGSLTVERAMDNIQARLAAAMAGEGLLISNRYSPGYCNWPVFGQRELFGLLGNIPLPVALTESCLMLPIKSVSGIIGVGKHMRKRPYACQICKNKDCIYRKIIQ
jgi:hypothetical protein